MSLLLRDWTKSEQIRNNESRGKCHNPTNQECHKVRHTVTEAAKLVGKNRRTLYRHIKAGRLSCGFAVDGSQYIDTSELLRVYGEIRDSVTDAVTQKTGKMSQGETTNVTTVLLAELVEQVKQLREENRHQAEQLTAIREQLKERPLLEDKSQENLTNPNNPEFLSTASKPTKHHYSSIIAKMRANEVNQ